MCNAFWHNLLVDFADLQVSPVDKGDNFSFTDHAGVCTIYVQFGRVVNLLQAHTVILKNLAIRFLKLSSLFSFFSILILSFSMQNINISHQLFKTAPQIKLKTSLLLFYNITKFTKHRNYHPNLIDSFLLRMTNLNLSYIFAYNLSL